jgi:hypothetical protein
LGRACLFNLVQMAGDIGRLDLTCRRTTGRLSLIVGGTGIKFLGYGEWEVSKHGVQGRLQSSPGRRLNAFAERRRNVHLAKDPAMSNMRAVEFTPSSSSDSPACRSY